MIAHGKILLGKVSAQLEHIIEFVVCDGALGMSERAILEAGGAGGLG